MQGRTREGMQDETEERLEQGVTDELLRLSCGIEDITDLLEDFKQALE